MSIQISRLDMDDSSEKGVRTCAPNAVMKCKDCGDVFYARHHEGHLCFQREMARTREQPVERAPRRSSLAGLQLLQEHDLQAVLDIRPVVSKIWRSPSAFHRLFRTRNPGKQSP